MTVDRQTKLVWTARATVIALAAGSIFTAFGRLKQRNVDPDHWFAIIGVGLGVCLALIAIGFLTIYMIKRRTHALAARLDVPILMVAAEPGCGFRQLLHQDHVYFIPPFVSVVPRKDAIELWGGPREPGPFAVVPRDTMVDVKIGLMPSILPRSAIVLRISGVASPVYLVVYGISAFSVLPARGRRLRQLAFELGLTPRNCT